MNERRGTLLIVGLFACALAGCGEESSSATLETSPVAAAIIGAACDESVACADADALCLDGFPGGYCSAVCRADLACPGGHACVATPAGPRCARACGADADCREGYRCVTHGTDLGSVSFCDVSAAGPRVDAGVDADVDSGLEATSNYGDACRSSAECEADERLAPVCLPGFPGGYCTAFCEIDDDRCGPGAICVPSSSGGICVPRCESDPMAVCRAEYGCCDVGIGEVCLPPTAVEGCVAVGPLGDGVLGDPCEADTDCGAGPTPACYDDIEGGYCTSFGCRLDADCGADGVCQTGFTSLCLRACEGDDECEGSQECCEVRAGVSGCVAAGFCE